MKPNETSFGVSLSGWPPALAGAMAWQRRTDRSFFCLIK
jgi:hypothetical protein